MTASSAHLPPLVGMLATGPRTQRPLRWPHLFLRRPDPASLLLLPLAAIGLSNDVATVAAT